MDLILVAGLWLPSSVWAEVADELAALGHRPLPLALPGVDDGSASATLADQVEAVVAAVDAADRPVVVAHSAAATLAWLAADRRPEGVAQVQLVGGFPAGDGERYADLFEPAGGLMAFPGWEPFEGPDSADLDATARQRVDGMTLPVPEGVSRGVVRYQDERRFTVPVVLVCPEFGPDEARQWILDGDAPELARARDVTFVDVDSGHWPMVTVPARFARVVAQALPR